MSTPAVKPPFIDAVVPGGCRVPDEVRAAIQGNSLAVMLYGSRARGDARLDSDVDVLQLVPDRPRLYSMGRVNVAAYTTDHLLLLAQRGSLFVRHLQDEGIVLDDPQGALARVFAEYQPPASYEALKRELVLTLTAVSAVDAGDFSAGVLRLARYAVRTALYVRAAESGELTFDVTQASLNAGIPELPRLLRSSPEDVQLLRSIGFRLLGMPPVAGAPRDLASLAVWALDDYPLASRLLEAALTGETQIDYTAFTLPPA